MTKTELMENYTAEQLAEMVIAGEQIGESLMDVITGGNNKIPIEECKIVKGIRRDENGIWLNAEDADFIQNYSKMQKTISDNKSEIAKLNCEVEKYRKAFEYAKKECDCRIAEYQNRVDKDKTELERLRNTINQIDDILEKLFGVRHDTVGKPDEFEKILSDRTKGKSTDFLSTEPIKVADMLINAEGEYEHNPIAKAFCGTDKGTYRIFDASELRQIAEHLLVYCNHNGEAEE